jgi:hypothetical protein
LGPNRAACHVRLAELQRLAHRGTSILARLQAIHKAEKKIRIAALDNR